MDIDKYHIIIILLLLVSIGISSYTIYKNDNKNENFLDIPLYPCDFCQPTNILNFLLPGILPQTPDGTQLYLLNTPSMVITYNILSPSPSPSPTPFPTLSWSLYTKPNCNVQPGTLYIQGYCNILIPQTISYYGLSVTNSQFYNIYIACVAIPYYQGSNNYSISQVFVNFDPSNTSFTTSSLTMSSQETQSIEQFVNNNVIEQTLNFQPLPSPSCTYSLNMNSQNTFINNTIQPLINSHVNLSNPIVFPMGPIVEMLPPQ